MCDTKFLQHGLKLGIPEAAFCRYSSKYALLKILQIYRKTSVLESLFNKVKDLKAYNFGKKRLQHMLFCENFETFENISFTEHLSWLLFGIQKADSRPFSYQKTYTKKSPWVALY